MAQLNPNFEIDFNDINSYEQIQLINDTQLAKENLLMHKAYKEPAEDEIIRNQFSSFTFVDFCPKLFNSALKSPPTPTNNEHNKSSASSTPLRHQQYMLETFSDLFDRINLWLKVNRDWRVISMETLVFDCASQFNHLKSSFHSATLPRNMRGLRLYLSPTKSRFSGPQKIGCINVIPRKISGHNDDDGEHTESIEYETLDQILARLNELLLTRPIEGRILSVETITLPIVNGYVNTETNYFMDNRLNALSQRIYSHANDGSTAASASATRTKSRSRMASETVDQSEMAAGAPAASRTRVDSDTSDHYQAASGADTISGAGQQQQQQQVPLTDASSSPRQRQQRAYQPNGLIDTLRVYYEFGPMVCGLVNLIDFLPRFNLRQAAGVSSTVASPVPDRDLDKIGEPTTTTEDKDGGSSSRSSSSSLSADDDDDEQLPRQSAPVEQLDIDSTESLTRLIGRSLNWFESERKRVLAETSGRSDNDDEDGQNVEVVNSSETSTSSDSSTETETETEAGIEANNTGRRRRQATGSDNRRQQVRLKVCNLQIHKKVMLKSRLAKVTPQTAVEVVNSRQMFHEPPKEPIVCHQCDLSSANNEVHEWCTHLLDLNQAFELKFIRLAYVVPVCNVYAARYAKSLRSLPAFRLRQQQQHEDSARNQSANIGTGTQTSPDAHSSSFPAQNRTSVQNETDPGTEKSKELPSNMEAIHDQSRSSSRTSDSHEGAENDEGESEDGDGEEEEEEEDEEEDEDVEGEAGGNEVLGDILAAHDSAEKLAKEVSLEIVRGTNRRHKRYEQLHQLNEDSIGSDCPERSSVSPEPGQLIGQLTYRLFAPCQLVNSSSCFSINPVNSSNPLARRGSVVSDGGSSSENATPSTLLLPTGSGSGVGGESLGESTLTLNSNHDQQQQQQQQLLSFGAFFPALSHDPILGSHNNNQRLSGSGATGQQHTGKGGGNNSGHRFATNEFEPVEAIRRRMEVYVTTNSMKVLAGETLVVNLSDHLSCLSNAIEQTIIKASFSAARQPSTWVSVYILYAAVDEPHLPIQLLEQQKLRERLELISEADEDEQQQQQAGSTGSPRIDDHQIDQGPTIGAPTGESLGEHNMVPVFDDDFKCEQQPAPKDQDHPETAVPQQQQQQQQQQPQGLSSTLASLKLENGNIRVELSRPLGHQTDLPPYNSAYDRTVALPTQPDDHLSNYLEPVDVNLAGSWALQQQPPQSLPGAGNVWLDENDLIEVHSYHLSNSNIRDASKLLRMRQQRQQQQQQLAMQAKPGGGAELRNSSWKGGRERKKVKGKRRSRRSGEHSQCSIM